MFQYLYFLQLPLSLPEQKDEDVHGNIFSASIGLNRLPQFKAAVDICDTHRAYAFYTAHSASADAYPVQVFSCVFVCMRMCVYLCAY